MAFARLLKVASIPLGGTGCIAARRAWSRLAYEPCAPAPRAAAALPPRDQPAHCQPWPCRLLRPAACCAQRARRLLAVARRMRPLRPLLHRCLLAGSCRGDVLHMESRAKTSHKEPVFDERDLIRRRLQLQPAQRVAISQNRSYFAERSAACGQERAAVQELSTVEVGRLHAEGGAWGAHRRRRRFGAERVAPGSSSCDHVSARAPALRRPPARRRLGEPGAGEPLCVRRQAAGRQCRHGLAPRRQHVRRPCRRGAGCAERRRRRTTLCISHGLPLVA